MVYSIIINKQLLIKILSAMLLKLNKHKKYSNILYKLLFNLLFKTLFYLFYLHVKWQNII